MSESVNDRAESIRPSAASSDEIAPGQLAPARANLAQDSDPAAGPRRFKTYATYKDSGIEWLGEIPAHWETKAVWILFRLGRGRVISNEEILDNPGPYPVYSSQTENDGIMGYMNTYDFDGNYITWTTDGANAGTVFYRTGKFNCTNVCGTVFARHGDIDLRFFARALNLATSWFVRHDINPKLMNNVMARIRVQVPPAAEQRCIASFLDHKAAKVDALVAKKERLITLLQEKRAALITRAVTKGLPAAAAAQAGLPSTDSGQATPSVPMKDSGVDWLGEIPAHWEVAPVYSRYEVALGKMLDAKRVTGEHLAPYLRNVDVQWDSVNVENLPEMDFHPEERGRYSLRPGDLLVCEGGEVGRTAMWRGELKECFYQKAIHRVRPLSEKDVPRHFYYVMYAAASRGVFVAGGNPNTIDHLTAIQLRHYRLPFPTKEEQAQIVVVLDQETVKIDTLVAKIREGIEKLKEYRTALISGAVTGKIDVRDEISL